MINAILIFIGTFLSLCSATGFFLGFLATIQDYLYGRGLLFDTFIYVMEILTTTALKLEIKLGFTKCSIGDYVEYRSFNTYEIRKDYVKDIIVDNCKKLYITENGDEFIEVYFGKVINNFESEIKKHYHV